MEDIKKQAELYAESFRYKIDDAGWYEQKVRDYIAGYETALRIHDVVGRSEQLPKRLSNEAYKNAKTLRYEEFVEWWDSQV